MEMPMEVAIERMTGIALLVVSLSHIAQPKGWAEFFAQLRARGAPGAFVNAMMSLSLGALIVGFHGNEWRGWPALVTVVGWAQVLKGFLHMCFPAYSLRSMAMVPVEKAWKFSVAGAVMLPLALAILVTSF
jgi:hypothetical protein